MVGCQLLAVDQFNADGTVTINQNPLHAGSKPQAAAMFLQATHQRLHNGRTATFREIKTGFRFKPFTEQCRHGRGIGVRHRHPTDQKAEQINPVAKEGILKMAVHHRSEGSAEMTQSRQMGQQATTAAQQGAKTIEASRGQRQQRQGIRCCCDRLQDLREATPLLHSHWSTQLGNDLLKAIGTHSDAQMPLREEHIPVPVGDHLQILIKGLEDLCQRITAGPAAQTAPE